MAVVYYPKDQLLYSKDTAQGNYEALVLASSPNVVLYFGTASTVSSASALNLPITCSWALTASISQIYAVALSSSWSSASLSSSYSTTASYSNTASFALGGGGTTITTGSTYPVTSSWATTASYVLNMGPSYYPPTFTNAGTWTWQQQGSCTVSQSHNYQGQYFNTLTFPLSTGVGAGLFKNYPPTASYPVTMTFGFTIQGLNLGNYSIMGLSLMDTGGKIAQIGLFIASNYWYVQPAHYSTLNHGSNPFAGSQYQIPYNFSQTGIGLTPLTFLAIKDDWTNLTYFFSVDGGIVWYQIYQEARFSYLTNLNQIGVTCYSAASNQTFYINSLHYSEAINIPSSSLITP